MRSKLRQNKVIRANFVPRKLYWFNFGFAIFVNFKFSKSQKFKILKSLQNYVLRVIFNRNLVKSIQYHQFWPIPIQNFTNIQIFHSSKKAPSPSSRCSMVGASVIGSIQGGCMGGGEIWENKKKIFNWVFVREIEKFWGCIWIFVRKKFDLEDELWFLEIFENYKKFQNSRKWKISKSQTPKLKFRENSCPQIKFSFQKNQKDNKKLQTQLPLPNPKQLLFQRVTFRTRRGARGRGGVGVRIH